MGATTLSLSGNNPCEIREIAFGALTVYDTPHELISDKKYVERRGIRTEGVRLNKHMINR